MFVIVCHTTIVYKISGYLFNNGEQKGCPLPSYHVDVGQPF